MDKMKQRLQINAGKASPPMAHIGIAAMERLIVDVLWCLMCCCLGVVRDCRGQLMFGTYRIKEEKFLSSSALEAALSIRYPKVDKNPAPRCMIVSAPSSCSLHTTMLLHPSPPTFPSLPTSLCLVGPSARSPPHPVLMLAQPCRTPARHTPFPAYSLPGAEPSLMSAHGRIATIASVSCTSQNTVYAAVAIRELPRPRWRPSGDSLGVHGQRNHPA